MADNGPRAKGGQGTIVIGSLIPSEPSTAWPPEQAFAVKKLYWDREDSEESVKFFKSFVNELSLMERLSHPNVIRLVGFVEDMQKGEAWVIIPWEENGNVREFLQSGEWDIPERVSLIKDVVSGLEYLHTREPPICHGDLKSLNILVNSSYQAVITDLESARTKTNGEPAKKEDWLGLTEVQAVDEAPGLTSPKVELNTTTSYLTLTGPNYTLRWAAPEILGDEPNDLPSDMWAFGWICWEIVTGKLPFEEFSRDKTVIVRIVTGKLPAIREQAQLSHVLQLCGLMSDSWLMEPAARIDVSTFRRKVQFVPSAAPSGSGSGGSKIRSATLLLELGRMYGLQNNTALAESHYKSALDVAFRTDNSNARADALIELGENYNAQSRHQVAEKAFREAHEIHSRIGNDLGAANALVGLGESYNARSRYSEAGKAFREAHVVHSRIGNDLGAANALVGLGENYNARSRYSEAEKAFREAHVVHSRIGNDLGAANALVGLGENYNARSRYSDAEQVFMEAHAIHSRIGYDIGAANALIGLGTIYSARWRYQEAEKAFREAHDIHSRIGNDFGAAGAQIGLGKIYSAWWRYRDAEKAFREAHKIHSHIGNDLEAANAQIGLGTIYSAWWRYQDAEKAVKEAQEIHSRIGNDLGAANALLGLGDIYTAQSKYSQAEQVFIEARTIHSRIDNHLGAANAQIGLGKSYSAWWRHQDAEKVVREAHEIHSRIGNDLGAANALLGLGDIYNAQSKHSEAEQFFMEAHEIHSRIGNDLGVANTLIGLGDMYDAHSRYTGAETAFLGAREIYSRTGCHARATNAVVRLGETYSSQSKIDEADEVFKEALGILSGVENKIGPGKASSNPEEDGDTQSSYSGDEGAEGNRSGIGHDAKVAKAPEDLGYTHTFPSTDYDTQKGLKRVREANSGIGRGTEIEYSQNNSNQRSDFEASSHSPRERSPRASPPPCTALSPTSLHETSDSLPLPSERMNDDPASSQMAFVAETHSNSTRHEPDLSEELTAIAIAHAPAPATEELVDLLQALGKAAPKAVRNKHKIYSILRVSRDICNRITEIENPPEPQSDLNTKALITLTEDYCALLDGLEETLLQLAAILPLEAKAFGADLYSSWSSSRSELTGILNELCRPPFSTTSSPARDMADDLFFDDCSWLSRLLYSGIHPEIATQFLDVPQTHPVFAVANGLEYLENQVNCGVPNEPTRELIIDIATLLAQTLASTSPDDDDDKSLQETSSLPTEADRDWLVQALADSFSILHLDSALQPSTVNELAIKWADVKVDFASRGLARLETNMDQSGVED